MPDTRVERETFSSILAIIFAILLVAIGISIGAGSPSGGMSFHGWCLALAAAASVRRRWI